MNPPLTDRETVDLLHPAAVGMAALRVWCGAWLLITAHLSLPLDGLTRWKLPQTIREHAQAAAARDLPELYRSFLDLAQANATVFAWVTLVVLVLVGGLLVLGLFTRLSAALLFFLYFNGWLATGGRGAAHVGLSVTFMMSALCLMLGDAGRFYGLDRLRLRRPAPPPAPDGPAAATGS
ncbi:MAG: hypothetical protein HY815_16125 [Candidatus Riflebacteria bacterium]|nr:hypothetical protein [Candidatus Riflebacteria bacterium]